jgi:cobalt-zinc-cadmium efflux system protein
MYGDHPLSGTKYLKIAFGITMSFFFIELVGGIFTNSLALLTDSWHMLTDAIALVLALVAAWVASRPIDKQKTFGYQRAEIIVAFLNGVFLWVVVVFIFYEALQRLQSPAVVQSLDMLIIASFGFVANGFSAFFLSKARSENLNVKGAFLHILADALGSIGAISAGLVMYFTGWYQADTFVSIMIGALIFYGSWKLIRESVNVLLEGVPYGIDLNAVKQSITRQEDIMGVHDLHVWCITPTKMRMLSCHVVVKKGTDKRKLLADLIVMLNREFGIDHVTIQFEDTDYPKTLSEH